MTAFDPRDPATWAVVLTAPEVAAIFRRRSVAGLKKACQRHLFVPAPFQTHPYLWRRTDVLRHVEGARAGLSIRRTA